MLKIEAKTKLSPEEAIKRAVAFFGPGGRGLEVDQQGPLCVYFQGGGGEVRVTACTEGKRTSVELESKEWDTEVNEFISKKLG
ncbi:MAG: hypothetical protein HY665_01325 [Chloroflexi bacterium]|nr:hypothetical protein [Chloroflexota bacterium]